MTPHRADKPLLTLIAMFSVAQVGALWLRIRWDASFSGWFYPPTNKPPWSFAVLVVCAISIGIVTWACSNRRVPTSARTLGLIALGYSLQWAAGLSENRGAEGIRDRITHSGHAEFVEVAIAQVHRPGFFSHYTERAASGELGAYAPSKPPGQLLLYAANEAISGLFVADSVAVRAAALRDLATYVWPLIAAMAAILLYALSLFWDREGSSAGLAAILFLLSPAFSLITLHADQVFYPSIGLLSVYAASVAGRRDRPIWAAVAGALFGIACAISFGMVALTPVLLAFLLGGQKSGLRRAGVLASMVAGVGIVYGALRALGYDWIDDFARGMAYHRHWKGWDGSTSTTLHFAWVNGFEYAFWIGAPLTVAAIDEIVSVLARPRSTFRAKDLVTLAIATTFGALLLFAKTKGESARLWFFLAPYVALLAARSLRRRHASSATVALVLLFQFAVVVAMKRWMDFW